MSYTFTLKYTYIFLMNPDPITKSMNPKANQLAPFRPFGSSSSAVSNVSTEAFTNSKSTSLVWSAVENWENLRYTYDYKHILCMYIVHT